MLIQAMIFTFLATWAQEHADNLCLHNVDVHYFFETLVAGRFLCNMESGYKQP